tara:strand:- start:4672 stop:4857 length:186 start_codon:yes stop_codon:yes gene_type:complete
MVKRITIAATVFALGTIIVFKATTFLPTVESFIQRSAPIAFVVGLVLMIFHTQIGEALGRD